MGGRPICAVLLVTLLAGVGCCEPAGLAAGTARPRESARSRGGGPTSSPGGLREIARFSLTDRITATHLISLLNANGILVGLDGLAGGIIEVAPRDAQAATQLLRQDAAKRQCWIWFAGEPSPQAEPSDDRWDEVILLLPYGLAVEAAPSRGSLDLGRVLRLSPVREAARDYPFVVSIRYLHRDYLSLGARGRLRFRAGYDVKIRMSRPLGDPAAAVETLSLQLINDGRTLVP